MHRGGVFLPPARVTVRINEKEKEKKRKEKKRNLEPGQNYSQKVSPLLSISFQGTKECHKKVRRFE
jgi:hypothetical protein